VIHPLILVNFDLWHIFPRLESPIFIRLRLQLLEVNTKDHADLLKSLYGLLMLLPQSQAYKTLSDRLATVSSLHLHIGFAQTPVSSSAVAASSKHSKASSNAIPTIDYEELLVWFESVQEKHNAFRHAVLREKSLLPSSGAEGVL
jgi:vacuole morphology and inheritance protein 14